MEDLEDILTQSELKSNMLFIEWIEDLEDILPQSELKSSTLL